MKKHILNFGVTCLSLFVGLSVTGCNNSSNNQVNVQIYGEHLKIDKTTTEKNADLSVAISVDDPQQWVVPETLNKITIGQNQLSAGQYTYDPHGESAVLTISANYIVDNVGIDATVEPRIPQDDEVSLYLIGAGLSLNKNIIKKNDPLSTNITLTKGYSPEEYRLPNLDEISVAIGLEEYYLGSDLPSFITYSPVSGLFTIDAGHTKDNITFFGNAVPIDVPTTEYTVTMSGSTSFYSFDGPTKILSTHNYNSKIYPDVGYLAPENIKVKCGNYVLDPTKSEYFWSVDHVSGIGELTIPASVITDNLFIEIYVDPDPNPAFSDEMLTYALSTSGEYRVTGITNRNVSTIIVPSTHEGLPVTGIDKGAFYGCKNLKTIQLPFVGGSYQPNDKNDGFADKNFGYIFGDDLDDVDGCIKTTQYSYNYIAYDDAYTVYTHVYNIPANLQKVTIKNDASIETVGIYNIPEGAFSGCSNLVEIDITESNAISLGYCAFESCYALSSFTIPSTVLTIGSYCFFNTNGLGGIFIPSTVVYVGVNAFYQYFFEKSDYSALLILCESSEEIVTLRFAEGWATTSEYGYVHSVVYDANDSYYTDGNYTYVVSNLGEATLIYYDEKAEEKSVTIPSSFHPYGVEGVEVPLTRIGNSCFCENTHIKEVSIPSSIRYIGKTAFSACPNLEKVSFVSGNTNSVVIDNAAFYLDYKLSSVTLPDTAVDIKLNNSVFESCYALTSIFLPSTLIDIGDYCFYDCANLETVIGLENTNIVTFTGIGIFMECLKLESIELPHNAENIPSAMFYDCISLGSVAFDAELKNIESYAFSGCESLRKIDLSDLSSLLTIDDFAFSNCSNLDAFIFPTDPYEAQNELRTPLTLGASVFLGCSWLGADRSSEPEPFILPTYVTFKTISFVKRGDTQPFEYYVDAFSDWKDNQVIHFEHEGIPGIEDEQEGRAVCQTFPRGDTTAKWNVKVVMDAETLVSCQGWSFVDEDNHNHTTCGEARIIFDALETGGNL